jgi:hypothetical protein
MVFMVVRKMMICAFWYHVNKSVDASILVKHTVSIFMAEVAMLKPTNQPKS